MLVPGQIGCLGKLRAGGGNHDFLTIQLARIIHDGSSRNGGVARDSRDVWPCPCQSRPSRLSQASAIAADALMNNAG